MRKKIKKHKEVEVEEESVLLKTIKLTKNINYLTEKLPKPNYSPLRYKSMLNNRSALDNRKKIDLNMKLSLPPIKNSMLVKSDRNISVKRVNSKKKVNNDVSLPRLALQKKRSKPYIY